MGMKIYLVDDDDTLRDGLEEILRRAGHEVRATANGVKTEQLLRDWPVDVVVCDLLMPDSEGFEVLRAVQRSTPGAKFIMISGATGEFSQFLELAPMLGADAVLQKPFAADDLLATIDKLGSEAAGSDVRQARTYSA